MESCLFCKIIAGEIPSVKVYEDDYTYAFRDINPQTKTHVLVVSKKHVQDASHHEEMTDTELAACIRSCAKVAELEGISGNGYRIVNNCGEHGCQSVKHIHFHVLGGEQLTEKMK